MAPRPPAHIWEWLSSNGQITVKQLDQDVCFFALTRTIIKVYIKLNLSTLIVHNTISYGWPLAQNIELDAVIGCLNVLQSFELNESFSGQLLCGPQVQLEY
jgi:hypothetical protein